MSDYLSWPPSSRGILSPSPLLALLYYFGQIRNRPYLNQSILHAWMLRDKLNGMIEGLAPQRCECRRAVPWFPHRDRRSSRPNGLAPSAAVGPG